MVTDATPEASSSPEELIIHREHDETSITVRFIGEIDIASTARVLAAGREALSALSAVRARAAPSASSTTAATDDPRLVLDLREVTFIDSAGVGAVVALVKAARTARYATTLRIGAASVVLTFGLMGLMKAFDVRIEPLPT